jgi:serine/threonine protein phosphatase 1
MKHIKKEQRREIFDYLRALPLNIDIEVNGVKYKLVHGAPVEMYDAESKKYKDETEHAVWYRLREDEKLPTDRIVIYGHTTTKNYQASNPLKVYYGNNRIGIDCGSGFSETVCEENEPQGRLLCLRLDDMSEFYSEVSKR